MKLTDQEQQLVNQVPIGSVVRHYKGKTMKILHIARHSEDLSLYVVYQKLYYDEQFGELSIFVRPLTMFLEKVLVEGVEIPRFSVIPALARRGE